MTDRSRLTLDGPRLEPERGTSPSGLVILFHGIAATGMQMMPLARAFRRALPDLSYVAPHAPYALVNGNWRSWTAPDTVLGGVSWDGLVDVAPVVDRFIDTERDRRGFTDAKIALVGFSQGGMVALHNGLRRRQAAAAIVGFSTEIIGREHLDEISGAPPVTLIHGADDPVIPVASMEESAAALQEAGVPVRGTVLPGLGHRFDRRGMEIAREALLTVFPE